MKLLFVDFIVLYNRTIYLLTDYTTFVSKRHNGNLLIDEKGHLLHVDMGYCLANSPGGNFGFETAAFKLTSEMVEVYLSTYLDCDEPFVRK